MRIRLPFNWNWNTGFEKDAAGRFQSAEGQLLADAILEQVVLRALYPPGARYTSVDINFV